MRPPVATWPGGGGLGFRAADSTRYGMVALIVLNVPIVSISITDLKPLGERPARGTTKLPAAPALCFLLVRHPANQTHYTHITKSIWPSSLTHRSTAPWRLSNCHIVNRRNSIGADPRYTHIPNINRTDPNDLGTLSHGGNLLCHRLRLLDIATNDAGIGA